MANRFSGQQNRTRTNRDRSRDQNRDYNRFYTNDYSYNVPVYYEEDDYFYPDYVDYDNDWNTGYFTPYETFTEWWLVPGPFTGYGPADWQRQDLNILEDINERLTLHGNLDARQINAQVDNGDVTLRGTVHSRREKRLAEDIADSVTGVKDVHNELHIEKSNQQQGQRQFTQGGSRNQFQQGMDVVTQDGQTIGNVKEVRANTFLVDRPMAEDLFIPFSAAHVQHGKVMLNINADQVNKQGWQTPETKATQKIT